MFAQNHAPYALTIAFEYKVMQILFLRHFVYRKRNVWHNARVSYWIERKTFCFKYCFK